VILCAQRSDWRRFRESQRRLRHGYRNKPFSIFVNEVRERRRAHELNDNVHLLWDPEQQSRQQNWIEFQDYHLKLHEWQKKKRDGLQKDLNDTQKEVSDTGMKGSERAAQQESAVRQRLKYAATTLRWHEVILRWIEQRRLAIVSPPVEKGSGDQTFSSNRQRRSRRGSTPVVLGKVRVSKSASKGQNIRTRTFEATICKPISVDSAVTIPSTQQMLKRREIKPRRVQKKALDQFLSQRATKANRFADTGIKSRFRTQCSSDEQNRDRARPQRGSVTQRLHSTSGIIKTRSQRISRKSVRWAPE